MIEVATKHSFALLQGTTPSASMKMYPDVNLKESRETIKLEFEYPTTSSDQSP